MKSTRGPGAAKLRKVITPDTDVRPYPCWVRDEVLSPEALTFIWMWTNSGHASWSGRNDNKRARTCGDSDQRSKVRDVPSTPSPPHLEKRLALLECERKETQERLSMFAQEQEQRERQQNEREEKRRQKQEAQMMVLVTEILHLRAKQVRPQERDPAMVTEIAQLRRTVAAQAERQKALEAAIRKLHHHSWRAWSMLSQRCTDAE